MRAAIFSCEDAPKWKGWTERLWRSLLEQPGDTFTVYSCHNGEFPDPATCRQLFDVIIVGGSHYSAYEDLPWIARLETLLPAYLAAGVRLVGCCFGHQIMAKALGGRVGKNPSGRFVLGVEAVQVDTQAAAAAGLNLTTTTTNNNNNSNEAAEAGVVATAAGPSEAEAKAAVEEASQEGEPTTTAGEREGKGGSGGGDASLPRPTLPEHAESHVRLQLLESHGDQVLELPPGAVLLGASATAPYELWALGDRCLAFQFHPELSPDLVYEKIWSALSTSGRLSDTEAATAAAQLLAGPAILDTDAFVRALCTYVHAAPQQQHTAAPSMPLDLPGSSTVAATSTTISSITGAASSMSDSSTCPQAPSAAPQPPRGMEMTAAADAAVDAVLAAAGGGLAVVAGLRQALEGETVDAAEAVLEPMRYALATGLAGATSSAELLTSLNREAAGLYGSAADAVEAAVGRLGVGPQGAAAADADGSGGGGSCDVGLNNPQLPLKAALASLGALEAQLDRLAAVVGSLEADSLQLEAVARAGAEGRGLESRVEN